MAPLVRLILDAHLMPNQRSPKPLPQNATYERWRWQVFSITWLAYFGFYLTRKAFWVAKVEMGEGGDSLIHLTMSQMGWIEFAYGLCYAIGQFVWGMSGDLFGSRKVVLTGLCVSALVCFSMGVSNSAIVFGLLFGIQGLCQSTGWAPLAKNVSNFFSQYERGKIMGLWCTNYAVGGLVASVYAGYFGLQYGYRYAFFAPALTLLGISGLFFVFQRNRPEDVGLESIEKYHGEKETVLDESETPEEEPEGSWKVIAEVLSNRMILLLAVTYFFLKPTRYAIFAWGPKYLHERLGTDMLESGLLSALFELAGPISVLLGGLASDRLFSSRRMPVCVICLFILGITLFAFPFLPATRLAMGMGFFIIGIFLYAPDSLVSATAAIDFGTKKGASTAAGVINGCGSMGQILGLALPAFIVANWGWHAVFIALGCSVMISFMLLLPQWNTLPKTANKETTQ
jgi:OPA family glycerol-3-phosphate transporter-like MFS transporter